MKVCYIQTKHNKIFRQVIGMRNIAEVDKNFKVETGIGKEDIAFFDVKQAPFSVHGVTFENGKFRRMPEAVAKAVSRDVYFLHSQTAGGRVRFCTDSPYIAIHAKMPAVDRMPHFALTGSSAFDLYVRENGEEIFKTTFVPPVDMTDGYESVYDCDTTGVREYTLNLPLYSDVSELYIGLSNTATVLAPSPYAIETPIVYYGSSITQGGCASRPGSSYESIVSRRLHVEYINLGFSGSAKGENAMIEHLASLNMSVFVCDYDHNAPTPAHLKATHEKLFRAVRESHPLLPIVLMTRPKWYLNEDESANLETIRTTYQNAKAAGDENVYLLEGRELLALCGNEGTVEGVHPTDFGFASMAKAVGDLLETVIGGRVHE